MSTTEIKKLRADLRKAFADYYESEGCGCCEHSKDHKEAETRIAKLLNVPKYEDGSGYDFTKYRTDK